MNPQAIAMVQSYGVNVHKGAAIAAPGPNFKFCSRCEEWREKTPANWGHNKRTPDGLQFYCKLCLREYAKAYYVTNRETLKHYQKDYSEQNKDKIAAYNKAYRAANRERRIEEKRQYRRRHADALREKQREWSRLYREKKRAARPPKPPRPEPKPKPERIPKPPIILGAEFQRHIDYFLNAKAVRAESTLKGYFFVFRHFGQYIGDKWPPDADDINGFLAAAKRRGCIDGSLFNYWRALRNWFNWLYKRGKIAENPILLTEKPPRPKKLPRAPKEEDIKRLFVTLQDEAKYKGWMGARNLALITVALDTGMRRGELANLSLGDIDLDRCRIIVRETKTDRERYVVITPATAKALANWLQARPICEVNEVFTSFQDKRWRGLSNSGIYQILRRSLKRGEAARFGMHALRHAYAIYSLNNGAKLLDIQRQLGHTDIATTARYLLAADDNERVDRHALTSPVNSYFGGAL